MDQKHIPTVSQQHVHVVRVRWELHRAWVCMVEADHVLVFREVLFWRPTWLGCLVGDSAISVSKWTLRIYTTIYRRGVIQF